MTSLAFLRQLFLCMEIDAYNYGWKSMLRSCLCMISERSVNVSFSGLMVCCIMEYCWFDHFISFLPSKNSHVDCNAVSGRTVETENSVLLFKREKCGGRMGFPYISNLRFPSSDFFFLFFFFFVLCNKSCEFFLQINLMILIFKKVDYCQC